MEEEEVEVDGGDEQGKEAVEGPASPHSSRHLGQVPITALIRFKTVSKDWSALIGQPYSMRMTRHGYCPEKIHVTIPMSPTSYPSSRPWELALLRPSSRRGRLKLVGYGNLVHPHAHHKLVEGVLCFRRPGATNVGVEFLQCIVGSGSGVWSLALLYVLLILRSCAVD